MKQHRIIFNLIILLMILSFFLGAILPNRARAAFSPTFSKKFQNLTVGKTVQYQVKNLNKANSVSYSVSNNSLASINKKTGKLLPKKAGKLTVKAMIYDKNRKKLCTLTDQVTIQIKKTILPNASFQIKSSINPWSFTLTLSCSRILLEKEIKSSKLTLLPKGKKNPKITANFSNLSSNGKEVTYVLTKASQKKLCPGDYTMNGSYTLESTHFNQKLSLTYQERLTKNTLSGFVFQTDGRPVTDALLSLKMNTTTKKCRTDKNGHYTLKNVTNPVSLTASKKGFQTAVIENPFVSHQSTSCENIILRSEKEWAVSMEFLITDVNNQPIPNASISILENKSNFEKQTKEHSDFFDSIFKETILFSETTDASGRLLLSNTDLSENLPSPCSKFTISNKTQLSYISSYQPSSNHQTILAQSKLHQAKQYFIYINKSSPGNNTPSYYGQKLSFSFTDLSTNHAFFHIQLSECPNLSIRSLSVSCENIFSPFFCDSLSLRFFHPNEKESFFQYQLSRDFFQSKEKELFISSLELPVSLLNGTCYLQIQAYSEEHTILGESPVFPVSIENGILLSEKVSLQASRFARILCYGTFEIKTPITASFYLYQKWDTHYFLIDTFSSDFFTGNKENLSTAKLLLSHLLDNQSYFLVSGSGDIISNNTLSFTATSQNTFSNKKEALYSLTPLAQILCTPSAASSMPDNSFSDEIITFSWNFFHEITSDFVRTCATYPNCVLAFYQKDGTLLTTTLTSPPAQISSSFPISSSDTKASVIDIYTNKEILITNQDSYDK